MSVCAYCGTDKGPFHKDHVVPRSRGGPDTPSNLVEACAKCNQEKSDMLPSEWLEVVPVTVAVIEARVSRTVQITILQRRSKRGGGAARPKRHDGSSVPRCYWCGGALTKKNGCIDLVSQEPGPAFTRRTTVRFNEHGGREEVGEAFYPCHDMGVGMEAAALFTHYDCHPSGEGYWIGFDRLESDWEEKIINHKVWGSAYCISLPSLLRVARAFVGVERTREFGRS